MDPTLLGLRLGERERESLTTDEFLACRLSLSWCSDHPLLPSESSHFFIRYYNRACNEIHEMASQDLLQSNLEIDLIRSLSKFHPYLH